MDWSIDRRHSYDRRQLKTVGLKKVNAERINVPRFRLTTFLRESPVCPLVEKWGSRHVGGIGQSSSCSSIDGLQCRYTQSVQVLAASVSGGSDPAAPSRLCDRLLPGLSLSSLSLCLSLSSSAAAHGHQRPPAATRMDARRLGCAATQPCGRHGTPVRSARLPLPTGAAARTCGQPGYPAGLRPADRAGREETLVGLL